MSGGRWWLVVGLVSALACGRTALGPDLEEGKDAGVATPTPAVDAGAPGVDASVDESDAGVDPDDTPWPGDTTPFNPERARCLDVDAGLRCGVLPPKLLESVCLSAVWNTAAERLALEALDAPIADEATYLRVYRDIALIEALVPGIDLYPFVYKLYPIDAIYAPDDLALIRDGGHEGYNCLLASLNAGQVLPLPNGRRIYFTAILGHDAVTDLFIRHTGIRDGGWAWSPYAPCEADTCLVIDGSRFVFINKTGDCRAPTTKTYVVASDGGITVEGAWDEQRHPSCRRWFDQARWVP